MLKRKMISRKLMASMLAVSMLAATFVGCGKGESSNGTVETNTEQASESNVTETQEEKPLYNVGSLPIVNEPVTLKILVPDSATNKNQKTAADAGIWEWLTEQTGITFEIESYPEEELRTKLPLIMTTPDDMPDIFMGFGFSAADTLLYGQNGQLLMLDDYIEEYSTYLKQAFEEVEGGYGAAVSADGHIYAVPAYNNKISVANYHMNSRFLENAGLSTEQPKTLEELYEVFKTIKATDANGDGIVGNEICLSMQPRMLKTGLLPAVGINCFWPWEGCLFDAKDDEVFFVPTSDEYKYLLEWLHTCYDEEMLDNEVFTQTTEEYKAKIKNDLIFMADAAYFSDPEGATWDGRTGCMMVEPLTSAVNDEQFWTSGATYQDYFGAISAFTEYPEVCMLLIDYLYSYEASLVSKYGLEGVDYVVTSEEPFVIDSAKPEEWVEGSGPSCFALPRYIRDEWTQPYDTVMTQERADVNAEFAKFAWQNYIKVTTEESDRINVLSTDLGLYCDDYWVGFITGQYDLEKDWDAYVKGCESMGVEELTEIYQSAYNRFYGLD